MALACGSSAFLAYVDGELPEIYIAACNCLRGGGEFRQC